jgi:hypothetical protein
MKQDFKVTLEIIAWIAGTIAVLLALYGVLKSLGAI